MHKRIKINIDSSLQSSQKKIIEVSHITKPDLAYSYIALQNTIHTTYLLEFVQVEGL